LRIAHMGRGSVNVFLIELVPRTRKRGLCFLEGCERWTDLNV
jgi:hypothetical protein